MTLVSKHFSKIALPAWRPLAARVAAGLLACLCASACSHDRLAPEALPGTMQVTQILEQYGVIRDQSVNDYMSYLLSRLLASHPQAAPSVKLAAIADGFPLAVSDASGRILISAGLWLRLKNEAQAAFVVAHELAHILQRHHEQDSGHLDSDERRSLELQADRQALIMVTEAGYDPYAAIRAVSVAAAPAALVQNNDYPSGEERLDKLAALLRRVSWDAAGTVNRRDFIKFKARLHYLMPDLK